MDFLRSAFGVAMNRRMYTPRTDSSYTFDTSFSGTAKLIILKVKLADPAKITIDVPCLWIPASPSGSHDSRRRVAVFLHGSSSNIGHCFPDFENSFAQLAPDYDLLLVEFPGFGVSSPIFFNDLPMNDDEESSNKKNDDNNNVVVKQAVKNYGPSTDAFRVIGRAVLSFLVHDMRVPQSRILVIGRSMSTGLALELVTDFGFDKLLALVLLSPIVSLPAIVEDIVQSPRLTGMHACACSFGKVKYFEQIKKIGKLPARDGNVVPTLIVHGSKDSFADVKHAHQLVAEARRCGLGEDKVQLVLDPEGDHSKLDFLRPMFSFIEAIDEENKKNNRSNSNSNDEKWENPRLLTAALERSAVPVDDKAAIAKLKATLDAETAEANSYKRSRIWSLRSMILAGAGTVVFAVGKLGMMIWNKMFVA